MVDVHEAAAIPDKLVQVSPSPLSLLSLSNTVGRLHSPYVFSFDKHRRRYFHSLLFFPFEHGKLLGLHTVAFIISLNSPGHRKWFINLFIGDLNEKQIRFFLPLL